MSDKTKLAWLQLPNFENIISADMVYNIDFGFYKNTSSFRNGKLHQAKVYFKDNKGFNGTQGFDDDDPQELVNKVKAFCNKLSNE